MQRMLSVDNVLPLLLFRNRSIFSTVERPGWLRNQTLTEFFIFIFFFLRLAASENMRWWLILVKRTRAPCSCERCCGEREEVRGDLRGILLVSVVSVEARSFRSCSAHTKGSSCTAWLTHQSWLLFPPPFVTLLVYADCRSIKETWPLLTRCSTAPTETQGGPVP